MNILLGCAATLALWVLMPIYEERWLNNMQLIAVVLSGVFVAVGL